MLDKLLVSQPVLEVLKSEKELFKMLANGLIWP